MRSRNIAILDDTVNLQQFFTNSLTGALLTPDADPILTVFDVDPKKVQTATPVATPTITSTVPGAYSALFTPTKAGWHWDRWAVTVAGKSYHQDGTFFVSPEPPVRFSSWPVMSAPFKAELITQKVFIGGIQYVKLRVYPETIPNPEIRLVSSNEVLVDWTSVMNYDGQGNIAWLLDTQSPALYDGVYTLELRVSWGAEKLLASPMYLKIEKNNDRPAEDIVP